ncbi:MAG: sulfite exporter TauE/SafE family protein [Lentisphaeria bacterium]|nr:sulfite exporter TauE/SafE family protein [Lentisphaeria bacterium]
MDEWMIVLLAGCIVFTSFTVEGIAGFGATVMALPFVSMLIGLDKAVPMLSSLSVLLSIFIVSKSWRNLDLKEYGFILLHVGLGVPFGLFMMDFLPREWLIGILAFFMLFVGFKGLLGVFCQKNPAPNQLPGKKNILSRFILFIGGIIQGAFSSGGPIVVMYTSKALPEKSKFRATLSSLWLTTNTIMITKWTLSGTVWTWQVGKMILCALPFIVCGMLLGDFLHRKVDQRKFTLLVYSVLILAAFMLGGNLIRNIVMN